ncbi:MAG: WYL domain-containing protein, partial [Myxococcota bacterium]
IRFAKAVRTYVEERTWHPSQQLDTLSGGAIQLSLEVGDTTELRSWVLSFGGDAEVLEPDALRREIGEELARATHHYRKPPAARGRTPRGHKGSRRGTASSSR